MSHILSFAHYLPRYRITGAMLHPRLGKKEQHSLCYTDEDLITLSYEAAAQCLSAIPASGNAHPGSTVDAIFFATTSPVFADRYHASYLAGLLNLPQGIAALDFGATPRAGTDAVSMAGKLVDAGIHTQVLVVAADVHYPAIGGEVQTPFGHAACAYVIGKEKGLAEIRSVHTFSSAFAEAFQYKKNDVQYDARFAREQGFSENIARALRMLKPDASKYDSVILNTHYARAGGKYFTKAGFSETQFFADRLAAQAGYTGTSHALFQLAHVIENGKKNILFFDYYNGTNVLEVAVYDTPKMTPLFRDNVCMLESYQDYLALRKAGNFDSVKYRPLDMFTSEMMQEREKEALLYLRAFECEGCKTVYYLKSARCKQCHGEKFSVKQLQQTGTVYSLTKEFYFPSTFAPITMLVVDLDGGGRMTVQLTDDMYPGEKNNAQIGSRVRLVLRKMMENDGKPDYFWKGKIIP